VRLIRRLRSDDAGFSMVELLVAMALGSIVLTALMTIVINGTGSVIATHNRTEAAQRGRQAMDRVVTLLNSQTCVVVDASNSQPPILQGTDTSVSFYANVGVVDSTPLIYRLRYDAPTKRLWEEQYLPVTDKVTGTITYPSYPASPVSSRLVGEYLAPKSVGWPIFQYNQFVTTEGPTLGMIHGTPLTTPLTAQGKLAAVRITTSFVAQPEKTGSNEPRATAIESSATVGSANAGEPSKGVNC
jgi:prepilin-type N-terminal cleavage/methylation domain-containing protein